MGCQMNENDTDTLAQFLINYGYNPVESHEDADLILINTCTVREKARQKAVSLLGRMIALKKRRPDIILGIMGCVAQQEGPMLLKKYPELDLVLGTREIGNITGILNRIEENGERVVATDLSADNAIPVIHDGYFKGRLKGYISIMEGCNNFCSYCIVPYVRGREKSFSPQYILAQAENLISQGIMEITLLGQNVNSYLSSEGNSVNFPKLIRMISPLKGLYRIRFTTSHPKDLSDELIKCFRDINNLCPHIHLPFQSGSNRVLKMMNRVYTKETYIGLINKLRDARPDIAVTSDVIVGFPGETDNDFMMTIDLMEKIEFDNLFSFVYSDRKGTSAEKMDNKISDEIKLSRLNKLQGLQKEITLKKNKMLEGKEEEILVEGLSKKMDQFTGRTPGNKIVNFTSNKNIIGQLVKIKIERSSINSLQGILINN
ncbi:MAG: tRNA (N6-isopentenyl adenosine(37)-C2)-methylthiotransferase MiaB [Deltaproteobacteria bacterium]|nr:tRNA (N6-isopentenyl adenosine(37)-C2)-methylthiotransferase MiaB [Deltaproteobacteria bacterium]